MISYIHDFIVPAAYALLPEDMRTPAATAMLLSIGLQESRFVHRRQVRGPARSFFQFERAGVRGVLTHPASQPHAHWALLSLSYPTSAWTAGACHAAIEHNDILATVFARLLLWTLPDPLPLRADADGAWQQYLDAWRPGKPRADAWPANYAAAWEQVL